MAVHDLATTRSPQDRRWLLAATSVAVGAAACGAGSSRRTNAEGAGDAGTAVFPAAQVDPLVDAHDHRRRSRPERRAAGRRPGPADQPLVLRPGLRRQAAAGLPAAAVLRPDRRRVRLRPAEGDHDVREEHHRRLQARRRASTSGAKSTKVSALRHADRHPRHRDGAGKVLGHTRDRRRARRSSRYTAARGGHARRIEPAVRRRRRLLDRRRSAGARYGLVVTDGERRPAAPSL